MNADGYNANFGSRLDSGFDYEMNSTSDYSADAADFSLPILPSFPKPSCPTRSPVKKKILKARAEPLTTMPSKKMGNVSAPALLDFQRKKKHGHGGNRTCQTLTFFLLALFAYLRLFHSSEKTCFGNTRL
eukprot:GHVT01042623.1.p1 GENE.GHVT01042623.1~~GHVT01042623.1.p1  ORF type:complete len:130 (+),score=21.20 GHVT01042623.1:1595-1984(+)